MRDLVIEVGLVGFSGGDVLVEEDKESREMERVGRNGAT